MRSKITDFVKALENALENYTGREVTLNVDITKEFILQDDIVRSMWTTYEFFAVELRHADKAFDYEFNPEDYQRNVSGYRTVKELFGMLCATDPSFKSSDQLDWNHLKKCDPHFDFLKSLCEAFLETVQGKKFVDVFLNRRLAVLQKHLKNLINFTEINKHKIAFEQACKWQKPNLN